MTISDLMPSINQLTRDEQIELACLIWDNIVQDSRPVDLTSKQEVVVRERVERCKRGESHFEDGWHVIRQVREES